MYLQDFRFQMVQKLIILNEEKAQLIMNYFSGLTSMEKSSTYLDIMSTPSDETVNAAYEQMNAQCPDRASKVAFMQQAMEQSGEEEWTCRLCLIF